MFSKDRRGLLHGKVQRIISQESEVCREVIV